MSARTATPAATKNKTGGLLATIANNARQYGIVGALLVIVIVFQILTGGVLLKPNSFVSLIQQNAYVIILAIGMVMVIIATHIDLSVGSLVAFIGGVCALLMERQGVNWGLAIVISLAVGLIVGVWQGFWVAYVGIPGFITTLAGMLIFRGLATVIVGESVPITSESFRGIARNYLPNVLGWWGPFDGLTIVLGILCIAAFAWSQLRKRARAERVGLVAEPMSLTIIKIVIAALAIGFVTYLLSSSGNADQGGTPVMLVIVGVLVLIYNFILTKTVFGRHVYAVGGNRKAAELSGINTKRVDFTLFVHMGFLSAVAAVCMLSRLASRRAGPRHRKSRYGIRDGRHRGLLHWRYCGNRWHRHHPRCCCRRLRDGRHQPRPVHHGCRYRNREDHQGSGAPGSRRGRHHVEAQEELKS